MAQRKTGTVKWFNAVKGFGFVTPSEGGEDLFVHQTNINAEGFRSLREGETVEFEVETGPDGRAKAINVTGPEGATPQGAPSRSSSKGGVTAPPGGRGLGGPARGRGGRGPMQGRGYYGYPPMPPFYVGYYFPEDPTGQHGRGRGRMPPHPPPMYFPGPVPPAMMHHAPMQHQHPPPQSSGLQVVVHNLPWHCTWQQLKDLFKEWKVERADIVVDQFGRSRGFGTVRLTSQADVEAACAKLNNTKFEERSISVRVDRFA